MSSMLKAGLTLALLGSLLFASTVQGRGEEDLRIAAARSTLTALSLTTATTIAPFTCAVAQQVTNCKKRRKRRTVAAPSIVQLNEGDDIVLDSSGSMSADDDLGDRNPRLSVTVWTTVFSPYTFTSTSINTGITFSISFQCTIPGQAFPPACG